MRGVIEEVPPLRLVKIQNLHEALDPSKMREGDYSMFDCVNQMGIDSVLLGQNWGK